ADDGQFVKQDKEFWFEDGTVILASHDPEFCVYQGVLAALSPVFKALFTERDYEVRDIPLGGNQTIQCPVVHVADSPEDVRHLLRACFSKRLGSLYDEREPSYHEISAAIRLGDKYKITELYSQSLAYLKCYFPSTLASWLPLEKYGPPGWLAFEAIGTINLACSTGELSILPATFLACICEKTEHPEDWGIADGVEHEDDSDEFLSMDDLNICFRGQAKLHMVTTGAILRTFKPTTARGCKTPVKCRKVLWNVLLNLETHLVSLFQGNPFAEYHTFVRTDGLDACSFCTSMVREQSKKERKDIWNQLPELLGINIPGWGAPPPQGDANGQCQVRCMSSCSG
ncbi:hypothetical protein V8D89_009027, partial [Ganoderma adspersum]